MKAECRVRVSVAILTGISSGAMSLRSHFRLSHAHQRPITFRNARPLCFFDKTPAKMARIFVILGLILCITTIQAEGK